MRTPVFFLKLGSRPMDLIWSHLSNSGCTVQVWDVRACLWSLGRPRWSLRQWTVKVVALESAGQSQNFTKVTSFFFHQKYFKRFLKVSRPDPSLSFFPTSATARFLRSFGSKSIRPHILLYKDHHWEFKSFSVTSLIFFTLKIIFPNSNPKSFLLKGNVEKVGSTMTRRKYDDQGDENSSGFGYNKENYRHDDKKETVPRLKFEQRGVQTELSLRTCTEVRNSGSLLF